MIDKQIIDHILETANISEVIGEYVTLRRSGVNYKGVCPFHGDKDASFYVSNAKAIYKCFGCGVGGNVINFVKEHEAISYPEAVRIVAAKYNITVPDKELTPEEQTELKRRESLQICLVFAQEQFVEGLKNEAAQAYLATRGIDAEILAKYGAGFAPQNFTALVELSGKKGYSMELMQSAGLVNRKDTGKVYDRFINRITFPFYTVSGKLTGFTGRCIDKESDCKYLNSPETELFKKGHTLFGIYQAKQSISQQDKCFLVEGQFDVLSFVQNGFPNTVCGSGTAFEVSQARIIKKYTRNVTLVYDGDAAGIKASIRNIDILLAEGMNVRAVQLPAGEDPDSFARKQGKEKLAKFIKKNESDFISFVYNLMAQDMEDPIRKAEVLKQVAGFIAAVPDKLQRQGYIVHLADKFKADGEQLVVLVNQLIEAKPKEAPAPIESGFTGLEDARPLLSESNPELTITFDVKQFADLWGEHPIVLVTGRPDLSDIQELRRISHVLRCKDRFEVDEDMEEPEGLKFVKDLCQSGFSITMSRYVIKMEPCVDDEGKETRRKVEKEFKMGFYEFYIHLYSKFREHPEVVKSKAIERCAEVISHADQTTLSYQLTEYARSLGIVKTALEKVLKPYLDARKALAKFNSDSMQIDGAELMFDPNKLPNYVEENEEINKIWKAYGFFPYLDKNGRAIAYIFSNGKKSYLRVGNFYIEPLLHIYEKESALNKRVVQLTQSNVPYPIYMEWISKEMITMQSFRQRLWEEGDINFTNGTQQFLDQIVDSWAGKFKKCFELRMYGWYDEGFFAFSNAIVHEIDGDLKVEYVNDLGVVTHGNANYYIPAFSKIYANERRDSDRYFLDRFMKYIEPKGARLDFNSWAHLMNNVYRLNNNGKWAVIYAIMCAFRSDIFEIDRIFTALFFIGPTGSGKSEIAYSIRSLFMPPDAPAFNLNSGSSAALFTLMERNRNIPLMLEEYNDAQLDDVKFQVLKSAVYDGEGKQKRKDANTKEIDSSQINAPLIILGQESPQRDDNSLSNRCIICDVPKNDDRKPEEDEIFRELKSFEKKGLHNILLDVLRLRPVFRSHYMRIQREVYKELKDEIRTTVTNTDGLSRILNTVSMFLASCYIVEKHTALKLPFTYAEFFEIAKEKVVKQVESISTSNRMSFFFSTISSMIDSGAIKAGRDFKIESPGKITLQRKGRETFLHELMPVEMNILHLNLTNIYPLYNRATGKDALSLQSLYSYLESNEAYIGKTRGTRFRWQEVAEVSRGDITSTIEGGTVIDNTMKRIMQDKESTVASVVLNYDKLKQLLDVDFERDVKQEPEYIPETNFKF